MIDNRTPRLDLPLPDVDNYLEDDVPRIKEAFNTLDTAVVTQTEKQELKGLIEQADQKAQGSVDALVVVNNEIKQLVQADLISFTYTDGVLTSMTEQLDGGVRTTSYNYADGKITQSIEVFGNRTSTTTYNYDPSGVLTGITKQDVFA